MTTKAWAAQPAKAVDEVFFQNEAVSLCLLVNRRARTMRVIDFRAGPSSAKRQLAISLAEREGVDKVYTLVERDELATWGKLGFAKEGNIPGFYKRSDAFLLGCMVASARVRQPLADDDEPLESGVHRVAREAREGDVSPAQERAERTVVQARKLAKEISERSLPATRVAPMPEASARRAVAAALRSGRALTGFEPFGRDVERRYFVATSRGGFELCASVESQTCFGNSFFEVLQSPRTEAERSATIAAVGAFCERLLSEGIVSCFSLSPSDDVPLAMAFAYAGFRRTGLLLSHLVVGGERKDAILWSRKLANPTDE
jgi:hypothetical protein